MKYLTLFLVLFSVAFAQLPTTFKPLSTTGVPPFSLLCVGDSVMSDYALGEDFWLRRLPVRSERFRGSTVNVSGVYGATLATTASGVTSAISALPARIGQTRLMGFVGTGANDLVAGATAATTLAHVQTVTNAFRTAGGQCTVFNCPDDSTHSSPVAAAIAEYNALLRTALAAGDIDYLVDINQLRYTTSGYVHPDVPGTETILDELIKTLDGLPASPSSRMTLGVATATAITGISAAASAVVTSAAHGLVTNQVVFISGTNSTPVIDGMRRVTVLSASTYSVAVTTTVSGSAGSVNTGVARLAHTIPFNRVHTWIVQPLGNGARGVEAFFATNLYNAATGPVLTISSLGVAAYFMDTVSPSVETGCIMTGQLCEFFLANKNVSHGIIFIPKLIARSEG